MCILWFRDQGTFQPSHASLNGIFPFFLLHIKQISKNLHPDSRSIAVTQLLG